MRQPARPRRVAPVTVDSGPVHPAGASAAPGRPPAPRPPTQRPPTPRTPVGSPPRTLADSPGVSTGLVAGPRAWQPVRPPVVSSGSAARFAERAAMRRRLTRQRIALGSGSAAVIALLGWLLFVSPVLAVDLAEVRFEGQGTVVDPAALSAVVQPYAGTPLPRLDTVTLRRAVLDVPGVRAAEVSRQWPHGLLVTVVSREPVAAVPQDDGGFALLDVEGIQVGRSDTPPEGLPVISVPLDDPDARAMTAVLTVVRQLPVDLAAQIATASADSQDTVSFGLRDGATVEWGSADQTALKIAVLATLRTAPASQTASVFDVSAPAWPITRS